jgi:hypothetical protein
MNNITLSNIDTVTRVRFVAPTHGFGMGEVCPQAAGYATGFSGGMAAATWKRHLDAVQATPVTGRTPWSPPVT